MIPNIVRGHRMTGLLAYLAGPGRTNEHTDPHVVAGSDGVMAWWADSELDSTAIAELGRHLDAPRRAYDVDVAQGHVWHCSLSLHAEEGQLSDTQWEAITARFMNEMGFCDDAKAPVRWAAIRHGVSKAGNDHVHLAVQWVREDGTKCFIRNDFARAQTVARSLEKEFGLRSLGSDVWAEKSFSPAERPAARRRSGSPRVESGEATEPRQALAIRVRAAAVASVDEAEFVRRARLDGLLIRPRFARDTTDVVVGYSVAVRPDRTQRAIWYGGGTLGRDLSLPRLREDWPDTAEAATAAAAEWNAASRRRPPVAPGRETATVSSMDWAHANTRIAQLHDQLTSLPLTDVAEWSRTAHQLSGFLGAWARRAEPDGGPLHEAALAVAKTAQSRSHHPSRPSSPNVSLAAITSVVVAAASGGNTAAQAALILNLIRLARRFHEVHVAADDLRRGRDLAVVFQHRLANLSTVPGRTRWQPASSQVAWMSNRGRPQSVMPGSLQQTRQHQLSTRREGMNR